jgi:hypothetical protein
MGLQMPELRGPCDLGHLRKFNGLGKSGVRTATPTTTPDEDRRHESRIRLSGTTPAIAGISEVAEIRDVHRTIGKPGGYLQ